MLGHLDDGVLAGVLECCGVRDAWRLRAVCRRWDQLVRGIDWSALDFARDYSYGSSASEFHRHRLLRWAHRVRTGLVRVSGGGASLVVSLQEPTLSELVGACAQRKAALSAATRAAVAALAEACEAASGGLSAITVVLNGSYDREPLALFGVDPLTSLSFPRLEAVRVRTPPGQLSFPPAPGFARPLEPRIGCRLKELELPRNCPLTFAAATALSSAAPRLSALAAAFAADDALVHLSALPLQRLRIMYPPRGPLVLGSGLDELLHGRAGSSLRSLRFGGEDGASTEPESLPPLMRPCAALAVLETLGPRATALGRGDWPPRLLTQSSADAAVLARILASGSVPRLDLSVHVPPSHTGSDLLRAVSSAVASAPSTPPATLRVGNLETEHNWRETRAPPLDGTVVGVLVTTLQPSSVEIVSGLPLSADLATALSACGPLARASLRFLYPGEPALDPASHAPLAPLAARLGPALAVELLRPGYAVWPDAARDGARRGVEAALSGAALAFTTGAYRR